MNKTPPRKAISPPAWGILSAVFTVMAAVGIAGGYGTYTNMKQVFGSSGTAMGVVAFGEGSIAVLGLTMLGLTLIQQPFPRPMRWALWSIPAAGSAAGAVVAPDLKSAVVFALTPLAMTASAESLGFLARRIVTARTGIDAEASRQAAENLRTYLYHRARSEQHPSPRVRKYSKLRMWRIAGRIGQDDPSVAAGLATTWRTQVVSGAGTALAELYGITGPELSAPELAPDALTGPGGDAGPQEADSGPKEDRTESAHVDRADSSGPAPDHTRTGQADSSGQHPDRTPDRGVSLVTYLSGAEDATEAAGAALESGLSAESARALMRRTRPDWTADRIRKAVKRAEERRLDDMVEA